MMSFILDEAINGWVLTVFKNGEKEQVIYETIDEALFHIENEAPNTYDSYQEN